MGGHVTVPDRDKLMKSQLALGLAIEHNQGELIDQVERIIRPYGDEIQEIKQTLATILGQLASLADRVAQLEGRHD